MITVGIPALKEPGISKCLKAILREPVKKEVIVVTPDEETARIARRFKVKVIKESKREGKPAAVNKILKAAKGEFIVLTDADMHVKKGSLKFLLKPFSDKGVSVVCGHPEITNKRGMIGYWGKVLYDIVHHQRLTGASHLTTNLCAFRKGCVKQLPREALIDDYVIGLECLKKGRFVYAPKAIVYVKFPESISDFLKQRVRTFAGYMQVKDWYGGSERSLGQEARGARSVLSYVKKPKHLLYIGLLAFFRLTAWFKAFYNYRFKKKDLKNIWVSAESTKG